MKKKKTGGQWGAELGGQFRWDSPKLFLYISKALVKVMEGAKRKAHHHLDVGL